MPYGEKTKQQLLEFSDKAFRFFEQQNVKAVVMACNTTSAVVYEELKDNYNFVLYPLIQSVSEIFAKTNTKVAGVFATPATVNSKAYSKYINKYNPDINVVEISCPSWVNIVENKRQDETYACNEVGTKMAEMLKYKPEKIILGCTHYPYLINQLEKFAPNDIFINPAETYAEYIKSDLQQKELLNETAQNGTDTFYVSSNPEKFIISAKMFYNVKKCNLLD